MRGRVAILTVAVTTAAILSAAFSTAAEAHTVKMFAIRNGVTSVRLTVPHTTGSRPPAILVSTRPANLPCAVLGYRYHAFRKKGTFEMRLRCHNVRSGARGRLVFRRPYVRMFKLHNGTGTIHIQLDKFPGTAVPLGQLSTRPRAANCTATPTGTHVGKHLFTASARVSCRGLPRDAKAVLAVGGLLAPSPSAATRSADPGRRAPPQRASPTRRRAPRRSSRAAAHAPCRRWAIRFPGSTATELESTWGHGSPPTSVRGPPSAVRRGGSTTARSSLSSCGYFSSTSTPLPCTSSRPLHGHGRTHSGSSPTGSSAAASPRCGRGTATRSTSHYPVVAWLAMPRSLNRAYSGCEGAVRR